MKSSLRKKYIIAGSLMVIGFLAFLLLMVNILQDRIVELWNRRSMEDVCRQIERELGDGDWILENVDIDSTAFENNVSVTITDENYQILYSTRQKEASRGTLGKKSTKAIEADWEELKKKGRSFYSDFDDDNKASFIQVSKEEGHGYIIIRKSLYGLNASIFVMQVCFVIAAIVTLVCGIICLVFLTGKMVSPIREINRVTGQIAQLNFDEKAAVNGKDELAELANSVNVMSDRLKETMDGLTREVEERKALVRNMAHELKTPTAVIMGYAENMPYVAGNQPEKLEKYCTVIVEECERMDTLIRQMLEFSAHEMGGWAMNRTEFTAEELLSGVRSCYEADFSGRAGEYREQIDAKGKICGDVQTLETAIYNLVKNAVNHGKIDGPILVAAREEGDFVTFSVFNQGKGIPQEEQDKIWDVFYKTDSSRTRQDKSFGVGLAIVKQTALAHGGSVFVKNRQDGVEVGFSIRKDGIEAEKRKV